MGGRGGGGVKLSPATYAADTKYGTVPNVLSIFHSSKLLPFPYVF